MTNITDVIGEAQLTHDILEIDGNISRLSAILDRGHNVTTITRSTETAVLIKTLAKRRSYKLKVVAAQFPLIDELVDRSFDLVVGSGRADNCSPEFFRETLRLLRPGGRLALVNPAIPREQVSKYLVESGFEIEPVASEDSLSGCDPDELIHCLRPLNTTPGVPARTVMRTERLHMRPWHREDMDAEDDWHDFDNPIYRHYNPPHDTQPERDIRYRKIVGLFDQKLAISDRDGLVGYIALFGTDLDELDSEMGINFAAHRCNRGYCKESLRKLCDEYFHHWGMERMRLEVARFNEFGIRCYKACGFREVKRFWNPRAPQRLFFNEDNPQLAHVRQFFRRGPNGYEVEFLKMAVTRDEYLRRLGVLNSA